MSQYKLFDKRKHRISFSQFKQYCQHVQESLNAIDNYEATYRASNHPFLKQHDGQYLEINYRSNQYLIKINILYSIAYQIPLFYFMIYTTDSQPLSAEQIYKQFIDNNEKSHAQLHPKNESQGIFLTQNPINKSYFYTLHHCDIALELHYLIPFYLSILGLHPHLIIPISSNRQP